MCTKYYIEREMFAQSNGAGWRWGDCFPADLLILNSVQEIALVHGKSLVIVFVKSRMVRKRIIYKQGRRRKHNAFQHPLGIHLSIIRFLLN